MILFNPKERLWKYLASHLLYLAASPVTRWWTHPRRKPFCNFYYFATSIEIRAHSFVPFFSLLKIFIFHFKANESCSWLSWEWFMRSRSLQEIAIVLQWDRIAGAKSSTSVCQQFVLQINSRVFTSTHWNGQPTVHAGIAWVLFLLSFISLYFFLWMKWFPERTSIHLIIHSNPRKMPVERGWERWREKEPLGHFIDTRMGKRNFDLSKI